MFMYYTLQEILVGLYNSAEKHGIKNFGEKLKWLGEYWGFEWKGDFKDFREALVEAYEWMSPDTKIRDFMEEFKLELEKLNCPIK